jgi:hypothetical protein
MSIVSQNDFYIVLIKLKNFTHLKNTFQFTHQYMLNERTKNALRGNYRKGEKHTCFLQKTFFTPIYIGVKSKTECYFFKKALLF